MTEINITILQPVPLVRQTAACMSFNEEHEQRGIIILSANQKIVGSSRLVSLEEVEEIRIEALSNPETPGRTVKVFQSMNEMQTFLTSRKVRVLLDEEERLLSPEQIDHYISQNKNVIEITSRGGLSHYRDIPSTLIFV
jgi:hypothetical protein